MRIFYIGPLWQGSTCRHRFESLQKSGHVVYPFDTEPYFPTFYRGLHSLIRRLGFGPRLSRMNADILKRVAAFEPTLIWVDKGLLISPMTLMACRATAQRMILLNYSPDDMINPNNQTRYYLGSLGLYDVLVTTKVANVAELKAMGARDVRLVFNSYHEALHRPIPITKEDRKRYGAKVTFVGFCEKERTQSILRLADAGLGVRVWGPGWENSKLKAHSNIRLECRALWDEEYTRVLCASDINLCFLRKENRDTSTARSVEIPACGAFMLAERTEQHKAHFTEDVEAVYFGSDDELEAKVRYYSDNLEARRRIAAGGLERCLRSGYSTRKILDGLLTSIVSTG